MYASTHAPMRRTRTRVDSLTSHQFGIDLDLGGAGDVLMISLVLILLIALTFFLIDIL